MPCGHWPFYRDVSMPGQSGGKGRANIVINPLKNQRANTVSATERIYGRYLTGLEPLIKILECRVKTGNFIHDKRENIPSFSQKISRLGLNI